MPQSERMRSPKTPECRTSPSHDTLVVRGNRPCRACQSAYAYKHHQEVKTLWSGQPSIPGGPPTLHGPDPTSGANDEPSSPASPQGTTRGLMSTRTTQPDVRTLTSGAPRSNAPDCRRAELARDVRLTAPEQGSQRPDPLRTKQDLSHRGRDGRLPRERASPCFGVKASTVRGTRDLLCGCHEHLGRDTDSPAMRGLRNWRIARAAMCGGKLLLCDRRRSEWHGCAGRRKATGQCAGPVKNWTWTRLLPRRTRIFRGVVCG